MGAFSFRFLAICLSCVAITASASVAMAGSTPPPPVITVNPGGTGGNGTGSSSVCDSAIRSMLDAAGSAQAQRDIQTISSVIGRPPNAMEINCYTQVRDRLMSNTGGTGTPATPCPAMNLAWQQAVNNASVAANCQTIQDLSQRLQCIANVTCVSIQDAAEKQQCIDRVMSSPTTTASTTNNISFDRINLYAGATEPYSVANNTCHPGIPTGVKINGAAEIVCPNPGCAPVKSGNTYRCEHY